MRQRYTVLMCILIVLACGFLSISCTAGPPMSDEYSLGDLVAMEHKEPAPASIVATVVALDKASLDDDKRQQLWAEEEDLLAVLPVDLDSDGVQDYLVYPAYHLPTFFGAHSIACWIFKGEADGGYRLVLAGRHDAVRILQSRTNGMRDIDLVYWAAAEEVYKCRYNGREYVDAGVEINEYPAQTRKGDK